MYRVGLQWPRRAGGLCYNAGMSADHKPPPAMQRLRDHLGCGPRAIALRWADTLHRRTVGAPLWQLSRLKPNLLLGGQHYYRRGHDRLLDYGVTAIVNMRAEHGGRANGGAGINELRLATRDNTPPSLDDLRRGVDFIRGELRRGGKVYIHCAVGCGRAPTMAAAYLISTGDTPESALERIRRVRPFINPTRRQVGVLDEFAAAWQAGQNGAPCPG